MKRLTLAALFALAASAAPLSSMAADRVDVYVGATPPASRYGYVSTPYDGYARGYERRVVEVPRYEERRFYGYGYGDGYRRHMERERWERERWERARWEHRRDWDRDGDGVPNRYDSRPDNPWRH